MIYGPEKRYGKALFELAQEGKQLSSLSKEVASFIENLQDKKNGLSDFLNDPMASHQQKSDVLTELAKKSKASDTMRKFVGLMALNGRGNIITEALKSFQEFQLEFEGTVKAKVVTAFPLAAKQKGEIEAFVKKKNKGSKNVELEEEIDEKLIGGFKVLFSSQEFDASLSGSLNQIKTGLKHF